MERFWNRLGVGAGRGWLVVALGVVVISVVMIFGASQLSFATGEDSYLDPDSQTALDNERYQQQFGGESIVLLFQGDQDADIADLFLGDNLAEMQRIEEEIRALPEVYAFVSPLTALQYSAAIVDTGAGPNGLISAAQRDDDEESAARRQADISVTLARLNGVDERAIGNASWNEILLYNNTGFTVEDGAAVAGPDETKTIRRSLASGFPDRSTAVGGVILTGNASLEELSSGTDGVVEIMDTAEFDGFSVITTGTPVFLGEINDYLKGGMLTLGAAALAVMAVVLLVLFRVRWRLFPLVVVVIGVFWAFAILGFMGIDLSLVTISGLPILIGLGVDFAIQVHNRIEEETVGGAAEPAGRAVANVGPALVAATVAGILAFLSLQLSLVPMIKDFGVMLAVGVAVLVFVGIVLPSAWLGARPWNRRTEYRTDTVVERMVTKMGSLPPKLGPVLIGASILLFIAGVALEGRFEIQSDPLRWIDQDSQSVKDVETLEEATGFSTTLGVLVEASNVTAEQVDLLINDFVRDAEERELVAVASSLITTMDKIINDGDFNSVEPTEEDADALVEILPPDLQKVLVKEDRTATQISMRLAPASLETRAVLVDELEADLAARIDALDLPEDSILLTELEPGEEPVRAVPAGLAIVGVTLLENLSANRAVLTYLGLAIVGLWLVLRYRSLVRALLSLVPIGLAVGVSSTVIALAGITLSPLTAVSGPLVIASCTEFSVLLLARYLEERQNGLDPAAATEQASTRTGRAFFTSAVTTIGGFAVLIVSSFPLLRDFGLVVTLNVAVALIAALVVMPPLMMWADAKGLLLIGGDEDRSVQLAAPAVGRTIALSAVGAVALGGAAIALYANADKSSGEEAADVAYAAVALPTTTLAPTTTTTVDPAATTTTAAALDPSTFGTEPPPGIVGPTLFSKLTAQGATPQQAVCAAETTLSNVSEDELIALGIAEFTPESLAPIIAASQQCQISQEIIDATIEAGI